MKRVTLKILLLLVLSDVLETFTHFCFKKSALAQSSAQILNFKDAFLFAQNALLSPYLWIGLCSVLFTFVIWSGVLSKIDLSVAVPVASFSYVFVPLVSIVFLHEKISLLRWMGILLILSGVMFVSKSSHEKEGLLP